MNFVANPIHEAQEKADIDIFVSSSKDAICMVEGGADEAPEADIIDALLFAHESAQPVHQHAKRIREACGKEKREHSAPEVDKDLAAKIAEIGRSSVCNRRLPHQREDATLRSDRRSKSGHRC